jgi:hypothetical protein
MARLKLFISYSSKDQQIIDFIENLLSDHKLFEPLIIARNREALKPLSEKVINGLTDSEIVIPILTKNSIYTQWINQEIGFAKAINKKISPVVERDIIEQLKGFIHNQVDIPYNYISNSENINGFKDTFNTLLNDLEVEYKVKQKKRENSFLKGLAKIDEINQKKEFESKLKDRMGSDDGFKEFTDEILTIEREFSNKINLLKEKQIYLDFKSERNPLSLSIGKEGYISTIEIHRPYINSAINTSLYLGRFKGKIDVNSLNFKSELIASIKYQYYYNEELEPVWKRVDVTEEISSEEAVEKCFSWLLDRILEKNKP